MRLHLSFALGGGASLGTFSGAALTESLKQLLLFAQYRDDSGQWQAYEAIELDVLTGASAGALSLALLLRSLAQYRDAFRPLGLSSAEVWRGQLRGRVLDQFGQVAYDLEQNRPEVFESLLALEAAQVVEQRIWTEEIDLDGLLGSGAKRRDLRHLGSIADRGVVDALARKYFPFSGPSPRLQPVQLLGKRLLFALTLSNVEARHQVSEAVSQSTQGQDRWLKALNDVAIRRVHGEVRIFDWHFETLKDTEYLPPRWRQAHLGPSQDLGQGQTLESLEHNDTWKELIASCIASGAFPLVFEPVHLRRYRHEYGPDWPKAWQDRDQEVMSYFDGGALNNEPVREATRLANYLDQEAKDPKRQRKIIFIDPNVGEIEENLGSKQSPRYGVQHSLLSGKPYSGQIPSLLRVLNQVPKLLALLLNEAKDAEPIKLFEILAHFKDRDLQRAWLLSQAPPAQAPPAELHQSLLENLRQKLEAKRQQLQLPRNTLQIQHELLRIVQEEAQYFGSSLPLQDPPALLRSLNDWLYLPPPQAHSAQWQQALQLLLIDLNLNLIAKQAQVQILPIAPFDFYQENQTELLALPGGALGGFAGFASKELSQYEINYGRYAARYLLQAQSLIPHNALGSPPLPPAEQAQWPPQLQQNIEQALLKRSKEMIPQPLTAALPFFEAGLKSRIQQLVESQMRRKQKQNAFEFRIQIPSDLFTLRGFDNYQGQQLEANQINQDYYLIFQLFANPQNQTWQGPWTDASQHLFIDRSRLFSDSPALSLELPKINTELAQHNIFYIDLSKILQINHYHQQNSQHWQILREDFPLDQNLWGQDLWKSLSL